MGDLLGGGPRDWTLDPRARHAMLLEASRNALAQGDPTAAVVLAEELLDETPDDVDALLVIAAAAPAYGHGEVGALAAAQAAKRGADVGSLEAAALLAACQVDRALAAADAALARAPRDAHAHLVRGIALELSGRGAEAAEAFAQATALDPVVLPPPLAAPPDDEWDALLFAATAGLDAPLRDALRGVSLDFEDLPSVELLRSLQPPPSPLVDALLLDPPGPDAPARDAGRPRIAIYRRNLLRGATSIDEVEARLQRALEAEAELLLQDDP
ncbi:MAG: hypothetical protein Q8P41_00580 [Pseudomonadota bacterium]|nr:hypothetical protein [Pseudomonadota bacterium]